MSRRKVIIAVFVVGAVVGLGWYVTRPVPGARMEDQGREHVTSAEVAAFAYNSNPPTSGPHLPTWVKAGVYEVLQSEGELIHSLEHGYVIISYNCNVHLGKNPKSQGPNSKQIQISKFKIQNVYAHEEEGGSPSADFVDPTIATGSATNETEGCKTLVRQLSELANKKKLWKLIVVPRLLRSRIWLRQTQLDTTIALTAWNYIDIFDEFDAGRIERFIDYHRDQGPEKTME